MGTGAEVVYLAVAHRGLSLIHIFGYADTLRSMQCEPEQQQRAANYIFSEARRVEAVSYTHLDVYKRQMSHGTGPGGEDRTKR